MFTGFYLVTNQILLFFFQINATGVRGGAVFRDALPQRPAGAASGRIPSVHHPAQVQAQHRQHPASVKTMSPHKPTNQPTNQQSNNHRNSTHFTPRPSLRPTPGPAQPPQTSVFWRHCERIRQLSLAGPTRNV